MLFTEAVVIHGCQIIPVLKALVVFKYSSSTTIINLANNTPGKCKLLSRKSWNLVLRSM
jgi:hypothetical protein